MSKLTHTPGPWKIVDDGITNVITTVKDNYNIAMVFIELEQDARLIAAAPEMLEMLKSCYSDDYRGSDILKQLIEKATEKSIEEVLSE